MLQWHTKGGWTHRAYWGENVIDWGKDGTPERLPDRRPAGLGQVGAAGGAGRQAQAGAGHGDRRLGVHPVRRHRLLGQGRHRDRTPQDGQLFDSLHGLDSGPARRCRRGLAGERQGDRRGRSSQADRGPDQGASRLLRRACVRQDRRGSSSRLRSKLAEAEQKRKELEEQIPTTLVFREKAGEPKPAFLLKRGEYDQKGEKVGRAVPAFLPPLPPDAPVNRLGLAQWLVAPNHPLTARVAVNRFWLQVFGTGIVKTAEDFGAQGEPPSHPELLDWLAVQFREEGWDVKRFMKRLVMSAAYRQSSRVTPETLAKDPANRLLARGPRFRLDAEMLRDQALFVERPAGRDGRRAERQAAAAVRALGGRRLYRQQHGAFHGRHRRGEGPPPQPLHLLEADLAAAADDHVRRPLARGVPGPPRADQHAAPGPAPDERAAVRRGGACPGRADPARGRQRRPRTA